MNASAGKVPDHLTAVEAEELSLGELDTLEMLVKQYQSREADVDDLEARLKLAKKAFNDVSATEIPNFLLQHGISEVRLASGAKVVVKEDASVSVPEEKREAFHAFLEARGEGDIIKLQVRFARMPQKKQEELFAFLNGFEYEYESERGVYPQTLKKYFKNLLGIGEKDREEGVAKGYYLREEDVGGVASVFTYHVTKIK